MIADAKQPADESTHHLIKKAAPFRNDGDPGAFDSDIEPAQVFHRIFLFHALAVIGSERDEVVFSHQQLRRFSHGSDIHNFLTRTEGISCLPGWGDSRGILRSDSVFRSRNNGHEMRAERDEDA